MKKIICLMVVALLASPGCASVKKKVRSVETLKYQTILIMPFTEGNEADQELVSNIFYNEMQQYEEIKVIDREEMNQQFMEELGLNHPLTTGAVDFTGSAEGNARRRKVHELYSADAIIFGSLFVDGEILSLAIQMLDVESGELTLSFTKELTASPEAVQTAWTDLTKLTVEKVIAHIQDNRVITSVYKYE